ncbi:hypothetical protein F5879DRAFT_717572 [Lentinula edodes]|nr:hypothetical protein F5879DRAFT_717572 [Lentinula edodes]
MIRSIFSVVVVVLGALNALAVPVERRESVLSTCNTARLGVISSLNSSSRSIEALLNSSNDSAVISASNQALSGLHTSQGGVATIVKGVLAGVTPDDTGVPAIASGLATVAQALSSINSTNDSNVQSQLATILTQVNGIKTNGDNAIAECAKLSQSSLSPSLLLGPFVGRLGQVLDDGPQTLSVILRLLRLFLPLNRPRRTYNYLQNLPKVIIPPKLPLKLR